MKTLLTDTVGFIRNLPANLIESFRSTLEDIENSDYIIHIVDINALDIEKNIETVENELHNLSIEGKPVIVFFNKIDEAHEERIDLVKLKYPHALMGSAKNGRGIDELNKHISHLAHEYFLSGNGKINS